MKPVLLNENILVSAVKKISIHIFLGKIYDEGNIKSISIILVLIIFNT